MTEMLPTGDWDMTIKTPIGVQKGTIELRAVDGQLVGRVIGTHETVPLVDVKVDGNAITWRQSITKPLRLNLVFEVTVDGDRMFGTSKAGRLPRSRVEAVRRA